MRPSYGEGSVSWPPARQRELGARDGWVVQTEAMVWIDREVLVLDQDLAGPRGSSPRRRRAYGRRRPDPGARHRPEASRRRSGSDRLVVLSRAFDAGRSPQP